MRKNMEVHDVRTVVSYRILLLLLLLLVIHSLSPFDQPVSSPAREHKKRRETIMKIHTEEDEEVKKSEKKPVEDSKCAWDAPLIKKLK